MSYINKEPSLLLKDSIVCFWMAERELSAVSPSFTLFPDAYIELVFCFGENPIWYENRLDQNPLPEVFVLGLQENPIRIYSIGRVKAIGIRFYAWGYGQLINNPSLELINAVPNSIFAKKEVIKKELFDNNIELCWQILENDCITLLQLNKNKDNKLQKAFELLKLSDSTTQVSELAKACEISERHLLRLFKEHLGASPKALSRNMRFQKVRDSIFENPDQSLTQLAYECGFSDQSHFIKDFYFFYGKKPKAFVEEMRLLRKSLSASQLNKRF